jgi:IS605 OrfB family transposase
MITIKKKHNLTDPLFIEMINKFNNVIRYSYNRRIKDEIRSSSDLEKNVKENMKNIDCLDASWIKCAVKKSTELQTNTKLYFGGKFNFFKRKFKKIDPFDKNFPLEMRGSSSDKGNRKAKLLNNIFTFKPSKNIKFEIELKLSKNETKLLNIIQEEAKLSKNYFNFKISKEFLWISFNEPVLYEHEFKKDRYLGIDLNPNWIALSILDNGNVEVYKELIDLRELNKMGKNKKEYELSILNKHIIDVCKGFQVESVCLEDLNISSSDKGLGNRYNKLLNNDWNRNYFVNNLVKWLNINSIKVKMVNPFYTSFMGQIKNENDYDSVAASKEVAFRGYLMNKGIKMYDYVNDFLSGLVTTRWKEMLPNINTFKELYNYFKTKKKSKNSYRFLFNDVEKLKWSSLRLKSNKSMIDLIRF